MAGDFKNPLDRMDVFTDDPQPQNEGQQSSYQQPTQPSYQSYQQAPSQQEPQVQQSFSHAAPYTQNQQPRETESFGYVPMQTTTSSMQNPMPQQNTMQQAVPSQAPAPQAAMMDESAAPLGPSQKTLNKIEQLFIFMYLFVAALLLFRFVLSLFGASLSSIFVQFVYDLTAPFMFPFEGMFGSPVGVDNYRVEFEVLVALAVYGLVFFGIARLIRIIFR